MESPNNNNMTDDSYAPINIEMEVLYPDIQTPDLDAAVEYYDDDDFDDEMLELMNTWGWNDREDEDEDDDTGDYAGATQYWIDTDNGFDLADEF
jgi:hypothetical protein